LRSNLGQKQADVNAKSSTAYTISAPSSFSFYVKQAGIDRWKLSTDTIELVTPAPEFRLAGVWGVSHGPTPDSARCYFMI
jgi:hypothetical protein